MLLKTTSLHEEGAQRQWAIATKEFIGDENGNLTGLKIVKLEWNFNDRNKAENYWIFTVL